MSCNFWNSCPRQLQYFPEAECHLGAATGKNLPQGCPWGINSPEHNHCFWAYIRAVSDAEGGFNGHSIQAISKLLGIPQNKLTPMLKEILEKIEKNNNFKELADQSA